MNQYHRRDWKQSGGQVKKPRKKRKIKLSKQFFKNLFLVFVALFIAGTIAILGLFAFVSRDLPDPNTLTERQISQTTKIYDRSGEHLLYEIFGDQNRTLAKLQEPFCNPDIEMEFDEAGIPLHAVQATIAAEDRKYCKHHGFDARGFTRAVIANLRGKRQGGSTLTQQLVKNAILSNEKTITRKAKELILALELERRYSKEEILQIYFNEIPYGSTFYGIESASQNFYQKSVADLSIAEAATLAALPQAPTTYINNPDRLQTRRNWIIDGMAELGFISNEEAEEAKSEETPIRASVQNINAPHFVFHVKELLEEEYGQRQVEEGGLRVTTSIDWEKQQIAQDVVKRIVEERGEANGFSNASLVAIDPKTGHIISMVGSIDYFNDEIDGQVNVATRLRQPGSSIKPIVYTRAFEEGYTPNTVVWDTKTNFPSATGNYAPNNYNGKELGPVRLRKALQGSLNIPAVKLLYLVGVEDALDFMERLGYTSFEDRSRFGLAVVLGGGEVQLLEHTSAYATFANEGVRHEPVAILKVEDPNGEVLQEWKEKEGNDVLDKNIARMITNVLADNNARAYAFGLGSNLQLGSRPAAAKTGTTNDYIDGWTMGYTPQLAAGVWAGNNDNTPMNPGSGGSAAAAPIWNAFMREALADEAVEYFNRPEIPLTGKAILDGELQSQTVEIDKASGKLATEFTPPSMREEKTFAEYHSILHYASRFDPLGPLPENPANDPYYDEFEASISAWITAQEEETGISIEQSAPPTEYDDVHLPENTPSIRLRSPSDNSSFDTREISAVIEASAPRGISRVELYLDGFFLGSDSRAPYEITTTIPNTVSRGFHTLKAIAYDDVDNSASDTRGIRVNIDPTATNFEVTDPKNGQTIDRIAETFTVVTTLQNPTDYSSIRLFAEPVGSGATQLIGTKGAPTSPFITFDWTLPQEGDWVLYATADDQSGTTVQTTSVLVRIEGELPENEEENSEEEPEEEENEEESTLPELNPFSQ